MNNEEKNLRQIWKNELAQLVENHGADAVEDAIAYGGLLGVLEFSKKEFSAEEFSIEECIGEAFMNI